jgi:hypothetical protein
MLAASLIDSGEIRKNSMLFPYYLQPRQAASNRLAKEKREIRNEKLRVWSSSFLFTNFSFHIYG